MRQWPAEIAKFLGGSKKVAVLKSMADLKNLTVEKVCAADIVLVTVTMLRGARYFESLGALAAMGRMPTKVGRLWEECYLDAVEKLEGFVRTLGAASASATRPRQGRGPGAAARGAEANAKGVDAFEVKKRVRGAKLIELTERQMAEYGVDYVHNSLATSRRGGRRTTRRWATRAAAGRQGPTRQEEGQGREGKATKATVKEEEEEDDDEPRAAVPAKKGKAAKKKA